ncbi:MAG: UDP-N-acetylmuramate dehydrogenase [Prevotella sp.]|nr:UDP-N-acetylmuramate dehydrogenase [Prevotella sp.]
MRDILHFDLSKHNTFGIHASCKRFVEIDTAEAAAAFFPSLHDTDLPLLIIGGGSNLLLTADFPGTVVRSAIKGISAEERDGKVWLRCGSGETWDDVVALCVQRGWYGAENLSLIPGDVGASAVQNIGAYGTEVKDIVERIEAVDISTGERVQIPASECQYGYRDSRFKHEWHQRFFITAVTYRLSLSFEPRLDYGNIREMLSQEGITQPTAAQLRQVIIDIRNAKLPDTKVEGNAGSFFVNPVVPREKYEQLAAEYPGMPHYMIDDSHEKIPAGWLIEQCGWKGRTLGRAGVHHRQALVLVNKGGATGEEVLRLCETVKADVRRKFGIEIHSEVNII